MVSGKTEKVVPGRGKKILFAHNFINVAHTINNAIYKGGYNEAMAAAIAAYRAGNAPNILQVFEVGTATMMYAKGAIVPVADVMKRAGEKFDP